MSSGGGSKSCVTAVPVRVTARLAQGAVLDLRWPQTLDGVAHRAWIEAQTDDGVTFSGWRRGGSLYNVRLPLRRVVHLDRRKDWHWRASCCRPVGTTDSELHWWHSRLPDHVAEYVTHVPPQWRNIGRYRAYRVPVPVTVAGEVEWHAWADPALLGPLLQRMWGIGKKWATGEGAVLDWQIDAVTPDRPDLWGLWWPDTLLPARPLAAHPDAPDSLCETAGVRPPYWHPDRQRRCYATHVTLEEVTPWLSPSLRAAAACRD